MTYQQEEIKPYHEGEKASQVEQMFDVIAPSYDKLNHRLSWNIDRGWRKKAIRQLVPFRPQKVLDIATGTGDFAIMAAQMLSPQSLVGADISEGMMAVGAEKVKELGLQDLRHSQLRQPRPRPQRNVPRHETWRTSEHRGADHASQLPHEAAVLAV